MTDPTTDTPAVRLRGVGRQFGDEHAVRDVDLDVAAGELICLLGASGSGKTTLLRMIAGFDSPTSGRIFINGRDVSRLAPSRREIGMVFQNYALFPTMSVRKNIEYGLKMRGWPRGERRERAEEMLQRMHLSRFADRRPEQLSGGQQQRVAIARALAYSPSLLLMDEPLGALDKALKTDMLQEISQVHREFGTTILYVTHDREEALTLADRVAIMRHSRLVVCDPADVLYQRPTSAYVAEFFTGANIVPVNVSGSGNQRHVELVNQSKVVSVHDETATAHPVAIAIRPREVIVGAHNDRGWVVDGTVTHRAYRGDEAMVTVAIPSLGELSIDALVPVGERASDDMVPGHQTSVTLPVDRARLVPDDRVD